MADFNYKALHVSKLLDEAQAASVIWARVKGFPFWPAQQMSDAAAVKRLPKQHKKNFSVPVMFFGTLEIAWIGAADVVSLRDGVQQGLVNKGKHSSFHKALSQVLEFLSLDGKRKAPVKWWCRPPPNGIGEDANADHHEPVHHTKESGRGHNRGNDAASAEAHSNKAAHHPKQAPKINNKPVHADAVVSKPATQNGGTSIDVKPAGRPAPTVRGGEAAALPRRSVASPSPAISKSAKAITATALVSPEVKGGRTSRTSNEGTLASPCGNATDGEPLKRPGKQQAVDAFAVTPACAENEQHQQPQQPHKKKLKIAASAALSVEPQKEAVPLALAAPASAALAAPAMPSGISIKEEGPSTAHEQSMHAADKPEQPNTAGQLSPAAALLAPSLQPLPPPPLFSQQLPCAHSISSVADLAAAPLRTANCTETCGIAGTATAAPDDIVILEVDVSKKPQAWRPTGRKRLKHASDADELPSSHSSANGNVARASHRPAGVKDEGASSWPGGERCSVAAGAPDEPAPEESTSGRELADGGGESGRRSGAGHSNRPATVPAFKVSHRAGERQRAARQGVKAAAVLVPELVPDAGGGGPTAEGGADVRANLLTSQPPLLPLDGNRPLSRKLRLLQDGGAATDTASDCGERTVVELVIRCVDLESLPLGSASSSGVATLMPAASAAATTAAEPATVAAAAAIQSTTPVHISTTVAAAATALAPSRGTRTADTPGPTLGKAALLKLRGRRGGRHPLTESTPTALIEQPQPQPQPQPPPPPGSIGQDGLDQGLNAAAPSDLPPAPSLTSADGGNLSASAVQVPQQAPAVTTLPLRRSTGLVGAISKVLALHHSVPHKSSSARAASRAAAGIAAATAAAAPSTVAVVAAPSGSGEGSEQATRLDVEACQVARVESASERSSEGLSGVLLSLPLPPEPESDIARVLPNVRDIVDFQWPQCWLRPQVMNDGAQVPPSLPEVQTSFALPIEWMMARPPRYELLKRNIWVSRRRPNRLHKHEISVCACHAPHSPEHTPRAVDAPPARQGCGESCLNRVSFVHCDKASCPCGEACGNRPFPYLRGPRMEPFLTSNHRGYGVRAVEAVFAGSFVVEYVGEVIDEPELRRRMDDARLSGSQHFYYMELGDRLFIDARRKGSLARLLNSSCEPNCETQKWHDAATGETRIGIFAKRDIAPGEELTYDYLTEQYGFNGGGSFKCMCGATTCRGVMDYNPEKRKDMGRRLEVYWDGDGVFYRGTIIAYSPTSRKHTIMYDDGDKERVCLDTVQYRWLDAEVLHHADALAPPPPARANGPHPSLPWPSADVSQEGQDLGAAHEAAAIPIEPSQPRLRVPTPMSLRRSLDTMLPPKKRPRMLHAHSGPGAASLHVQGASPLGRAFSVATAPLSMDCNGLESLLQAAEAMEEGQEPPALRSHQQDTAEAPPATSNHQQQQHSAGGNHHAGYFSRSSVLAAKLGTTSTVPAYTGIGPRHSGRAAGTVSGLRMPSTRRSAMLPPPSPAQQPPQPSPGLGSKDHWEQREQRDPGEQRGQPAGGGGSGGRGVAGAPLPGLPGTSGPMRVEDVLGIRLPTCGVPLFHPAQGHRHTSQHGQQHTGHAHGSASSSGGGGGGGSGGGVGHHSGHTALHKGLIAFQQQQAPRPLAAAPPPSLSTRQLLLDTLGAGLPHHGGRASSCGPALFVPSVASVLSNSGGGAMTAALSGGHLGASCSAPAHPGRSSLSGSLSWLNHLADSPMLAAGHLGAALRSSSTLPSLFTGDVHAIRSV